MNRKIMIIACLLSVGLFRLYSETGPSDKYMSDDSREVYEINVPGKPGETGKAALKLPTIQKIM